MKKNTFIPNWYIDKKNKTKMKIIKIGIMLFFILDIILLGVILNITNKTGNIEGESNSTQKNSGIELRTKQDIIIIEKYNKLNNFLKENGLNYKDITITDNSFEMNIEVKNYEEYIKVISCIENKYPVKKLTPNKDKLTFNIKCEV
ncbi:hypothetical protein LL037_19510 [Clostridium estertheticum]|uniref:Uncharacterized protein n=1 Tax=Clostridium estertheticum TaxID=238834 RepID=A0AA47EJB0_9CLOT|nr:hypothetical protein [Clostridium estertheticum]MBU3155219.1 hypothetical protein [Clostridium estertheticum]MBU3198656.1 hypothetical protein [Clostridium estertheticum]WAG61273.1 hypothetical protein LL038_03195 [Clostridium estertheticum]WAG64631.1 hypothetical protein LL037_19510 [Clostridium estertheticum]